ncbi:MAG: hypothetical protein ACD_45C00332G0004 [uncultured bacterium]|nr:MAG: hypothetical protein ACD_45C00332G0004 [uncultured bacterium]
MRTYLDTPFLDAIEDTTLHSFSFLNTTELTRAGMVCKDWRELARKDELWISFIRDSHLEEFKKSQLSAKEFYSKNVHARTDTFYCVAKIIDVSNNTKPILSLNNHQLSTAFQIEEKEQFVIFKEYKEAMTCADFMSQAHDFFSSDIFDGWCNYPPIFAIKLRNNQAIIQTEKAVLKTSKEYDEDENHYLPCFTTDPENIIKIYEATYKSGLIFLAKTENNRFRKKEQQFVVNISPAQEKLLLSQAKNQIQPEISSSNRSCVIS